MATLSEIQAKIEKLQAQAEQIVRKQSSTVIAKIRSLMEQHGLTLADIESDVHGAKLDGHKAGPSDDGAKHAAAVKYRDPKTGATWTGHGRAPAWIANAKNRDRFLIAGETATSPAVAAKQPKTGNYVRGPQAPKYRDPETGATWSGRGKAPAWLAGAKDRTAYLIDTATRKVVASEAAPAKKSAAKNVATEKVGAKKAVTKKVAGKKVVAKKAAAKKATAKSSGATAKKAATKKRAVAGKKVPAKKAVARKTPASVQVPPLAAERDNTEGSATSAA